MKFKSNIELQAGLEDNNAASGTTGQVLSSTGTGVEWIDQSALTDVQSNFVYFDVKNETGSTINKGKGVMAVGTDGNSGHILIDEMVADGSVESKYFLGVLETTVANGGFARVISFGQLSQFDTRGQNGETWADGQVLWCDPANNGDFTITEPDGPNVKIAAAFILNSSTNGKIQVRVQANEGVHDLHDTKITSQVDGDVLVWDNTTGVWFNDSTLNVDYANGRVGIGTTAPALQSAGIGMHVSAATSSEIKFTTNTSGHTATDGTALVANGTGFTINNREAGYLSLGTNNSPRLYINSTGNVGIGTTSPSEKLTVTGNIQLTDKANSVLFGSAGSDGTWGAPKITRIGSSLIMSDYSGIQLGGYNGSSYGARMVVKGTGEVGIGTDSPTAKLQVEGIAFLNDGNLKITNNSITNYYDSDKMNSYGTYYDWKFAGTRVMRINSSGRVDITGNLDVTDGTDSVNIYYAGIMYKRNTSYLRPDTNGTRSLFIGGPSQSIADWNNVYLYTNGSNDFKWNDEVVATQDWVTSQIETVDTLQEVTVNGNTTDQGITINTNDLLVNTTGGYVQVDVSDNSLKLADNTRIKIGTGSDLQLGHDGTDSFINQAGAGALIHQVGGNNVAYWRGDATSFQFFDNKKISLGNDQDLQLYHNGTNSYIADAGVGELRVLASTFSLRNSGDTKLMITAIQNGAVNLYHNNVLKLNTTASGVDITGDLDVTGNVGIGTASPQHKMSINGGDVAVNNGNSFIVGGAITGNTEIGKVAATAGQFQLITEGIRDIRFDSTTYGNIMFLEGSNGNVGIGTTSPVEKLEVVGDTFINGQIYGGVGAYTTGGTTDWNHSTNARSGNGYTLLRGNATNGPAGSEYYHPFSFEYSKKDGTGNLTQFAIPYSANDTGMYFRSRYNSNWNGWTKIWTSNNDGSGSGLDADLLDGVQGSSYLRSDTSDTMTGLLIAEDGIRIDSGNLEVSGTGIFGSNLTLTNGIILATTTGTGRHTFTSASDSPIRIVSSDAYTGVQFKDTNATTDLFYEGLNNRFLSTANWEITQNLDVSGRIQVGSSSASDASIISQPGDIQLRVGSISTIHNPFIRLQGANNTSAVYADVKLDAENQKLVFNDPGTTGGSTGTNPMTLDSSGNLDVSGDVTAQGDTVTLLNENSGNKNINIRKRFDGSSYINWIRSSNTDAYIGVDETENLQIGYASSGLNRDLIFTSNNSEVIRFDRQGNVGIGTTSPGEKLHVAGNLILNNAGEGWIKGYDDYHSIKFRAGGANKTEYYEYGGTLAAGLGHKFFTGGTTGQTLKLQIANDGSYFSGNVGIGTDDPSETLEVAGNIKANAFGSESNTYTRVYSPEGATYNGGSSNTGMLTVILPQIGLNTMLKMTIRVFDYTNNESFDVYVAGYLYGNPNTLWTRCQAHILCDPQTDRNFTVSFGKDSNGKGCIFIGNTTSTWSYVKFGVIDAQFSHSQTSLDKWIDGWNATVLNDLTGYTVTLAVPNTQATNWKRNGQDVYYGSGTGNVGIGTTNPIGKLHLSTGTTNGPGDTLYIERPSASNYSGISFATSGSVDWSIGHNSAGGFSIYENGQAASTRFIIKDGGDVGIGTTNPVNKLNVNGDIGYTGVIGQGSIYGNSGNSSFATLQLYNPSNGYTIINNQSYGYYFNTSGSTKVTILNDGKVGIGETNPAYKLDINGGDGVPLRLYSSADAQLMINSPNSWTGIGFNDGAASGTDYIWHNGVHQTFAIGGGGSNVSGKKLHVHGAMTVGSGLVGTAVPTDGLLVEGNVGIGTTSPQAELDVRGGASTTLIVGSGGNTADDAQTIEFRDRYGVTGFDNGQIGSFIKQVRDGTSGRYDLTFGTTNSNTADATEKMRLTQDGNVGIGTTSPQQKLQVASPSATSVVLGASYLSTNNNNFFEVGIDANDGYLNLRNSGVSTTVHIDSDGDSFFNGGNVGIGTTNPYGKLHVLGSATGAAGMTVHNNLEATGNSAALWFKVAGSTSDYRKGAVLFVNDGTGYGRGDFYFASNTSTASASIASTSDAKMVIKGATGSVGIGTTTPEGRFEVKTIDSNRYIRFKAPNGEQRFQFYTGGTGNAAAQYMYNSDGTTRNVQISAGGTSYFNAGNVGIGTTNPAQHISGTERVLHIANTNVASLNLDSTGGSGDCYVLSSTASGRFSIYNDDTNTTPFTISDSGYVGIGTTDPFAKLHVLGSGENGGILFNNSGAQEHRFYSSANSQFNAIGSSTPIWYWAQYTGVGVEPNYKMTLNNTGLGIGTTSPGAKLHTVQTLTEAEGLRVDGASGGFALLVQGGTSYKTSMRNASIGNNYASSNAPANGLIVEGNVGIGTTSPVFKLDVHNSGSGIRHYGDSNNQLETFCYGSYQTLIATNGSVTNEFGYVGGNFYIQTNDEEKFRITSSGNVGVGTTSPSSRLHVAQTLSSSSVPMVYFEADSSTYTTTNVRVDNVEYGAGMSFYRAATYDNKAIAFINGTTQVGSISINTSSTSYNTTSDYRLKENLTEITDGIERVKQLQPKRFNFIGDTDTVDGFIAHEAQEVVPEAVTGEKDGVLPNGDPIYQGIDQAKLVPLLTAALQEAITKIEQLETRIQTLENK